MKKAKDDMRAEYKRSDFSKLERGKFHAEVTKGVSVALLSPENAKAFPDSRAVNDALASLLDLTRKTARITQRTVRHRSKVVRAG